MSVLIVRDQSARSGRAPAQQRSDTGPAPHLTLVPAGTERATSPGPQTAAAALAALAVLQATWGMGWSWPAANRTALAAGAIGSPHFPAPKSCFAVAGLLTAAAALVRGRPRRAPRLSRAGSAGVVTVLAARGLLGLAGRTDLVSPGSTGPQFRRVDRRSYSPLCLASAGLALPATRALNRGSAAVR